MLCWVVEVVVCTSRLGFSFSLFPLHHCLVQVDASCLSKEVMTDNVM